MLPRILCVTHTVDLIQQSYVKSIGLQVLLPFSPEKQITKSIFSQLQLRQLKCEKIENLLFQHKNPCKQNDNSLNQIFSNIFNSSQRRINHKIKIKDEVQINKFLKNIIENYPKNSRKETLKISLQQSNAILTYATGGVLMGINKPKYLKISLNFYFMPHTNKNPFFELSMFTTKFKKSGGLNKRELQKAQRKYQYNIHKLNKINQSKSKILIEKTYSLITTGSQLISKDLNKFHPSIEQKLEAVKRSLTLEQNNLCKMSGKSENKFDTLESVSLKYHKDNFVFAQLPKLSMFYALQGQRKKHTNFCLPITDITKTFSTCPTREFKYLSIHEVQGKKCISLQFSEIHKSTSTPGEKKKPEEKLTESVKIKVKEVNDFCNISVRPPVQGGEEDSGQYGYCCKKFDLCPKKPWYRKFFPEEVICAEKASPDECKSHTCTDICADDSCDIGISDQKFGSCENICGPDDYDPCAVATKAERNKFICNKISNIECFKKIWKLLQAKKRKKKRKKIPTKQICFSIRKMFSKKAKVISSKEIKVCKRSMLSRKLFKKGKIWPC